jgi:hypothetical protein
MSLKNITQCYGSKRAIGPWCRNEREKILVAQKFTPSHLAVRQSNINPRTGLADCTLRRGELVSARRFSGLKKLPFHFQEKPTYPQKQKAARVFCFWLICSRWLGGSVLPVDRIHRSAE